MDHNVILAGLDPLTYIAIASLVAGLALAVTQKKPKLAKGDDAVESNATRGSYIPLLIGRHRVGPIFGWVKDVTDDASFTGGSTPAFGKGGPPTGGTANYREEALHLLTVGPGSRLLAIYENGEKIWHSDDFTPSTVASGTSTTIPGKGVFKVYWGFPDDPFMTSPTGVARVFPQVFKLLWQPKELGSSRNWGRLEYEVECPSYSQIGSTPTEVPLLQRAFETFEDLVGTIPVQLRHNATTAIPLTDPAEFFIAGCNGTDTVLLYDNTQRVVVTDLGVGGPYSVVYTVAELSQNVFRAGKVLSLSTPNNAIATTIPSYGSTLASMLPANNTYYQFRIVRTFPVNIAHVATGGVITNPVVFRAVAVQVERIVDPLRYISEGPEGAPGTRTVDNTLTSFNFASGTPGNYVQYARERIGFATLFEPDLDSIGYNPIHILDQLLFARFPYGCGKDRSQFSAQSIENCAFQIQEEGIRGNIRVKDGEGLESVISGIMQDLGLFIPWDPNRGKFVFRLVRFVDPDAVPEVPEGMILSEPELQNSAGEKKVDTIAFTFEDRTRNYRQEPIAVTDTGQVMRQESVKAKQVPIEVSTDYNSSSRIALRRQQEVLGDLVSLRWDLNHIANCAVPGDVFRAPSVEDASVTFRVTAVKPDINSTKAQVMTLVDSYTQPTPTVDDFEPEQALQQRQSSPTYSEQAALEDFVAFEMPRELSDDRIGVLFLAVRSSTRTTGGIVWLSRDGSSYQRAGYAVLCVRATLVNPLGTDVWDDDGPIAIANLSIDFDSRVQDLTLDETAWRSGKQLAIIGSELCYLKNGEDIGGGFGELTGLIRGRLGTKVQSHDEDTPVYILLAQSVDALFSTAFVPGVDVDVKIQAYERSRAYDLSLITEQTLPIVGKAFTPYPVSAMRLPGYASDYADGDDIEVRWCYHSEEYPRTGLGQQGFGDISGISAPRGYFLVDVLDDADVVLATTKVEVASFALTADYRAELGLDLLPYWKLRVRQVEGSFTSVPTTIQLQVSA